MRNIILVVIIVVFSIFAGDEATFIRQSGKLSVAIDSVNSAIENNSNTSTSCFCVYRIGDEDLYATNLQEYEVLKRMARLDSALKQSVACGFIDKDTYESMSVAMVESFKTKSSLEW